MRNALIELQGISKRFNGHTVLDRVDLKIFEGEVTTIIGKSGTGKSVLLKHIIGLLTPDEGTILFDGQPLEKMGKAERNRCISRISYMFQQNALFDSMTVFDNIALPLRQTTNLSRKAIEERVMEKMEKMEIGEVAHKYPSELSGGMQKRVALSRALVTEPKIVLFDEPTTGQDIIRRNAILSMIAESQRKLGFTAILISHDLPDVLFISNRIIALSEGKIIFQGTAEAFEKFQHPFVEEFIKSIEGFQEHLTGVYSKRQFQARYHMALSHKRKESYVVALFTLGDFEELCECMGHTIGHEVLGCLGTYINKHFGSVGGFSVRRSQNQFATVLPFCTLDEAKQILQDFSVDLQEQGLRTIQAEAHVPGELCYEFAILAGLAEVKSSAEEIDLVLESAAGSQRQIARVHCDMRR
jgi:phospholipid/cholesterol/gamma-HCH transport system ATP-binding protein